MIRVIEVQAWSGRFRVDLVFVLVGLETVLKGVLAPNVLQASCELVAVAILYRLQTKSLTDEVALYRATRALDEGEANTAGAVGGRLGHRQYRTATQHREAVGDERFAGQFRDGISALEVQAYRELADEVRRESRIQTKRVIGAARFGRAAEACRVGAEAGEPKKVTFLPCKITEGREVERVVLVDLPRELARVKRGRDFVVDFLEESLGQEVVLPCLRVKRAEEPQLVLDDRTAKVETCVNFREAIRGSARERNSRRLDLADEAFGCKVREHITVELVCAALGNDVEDAAGGFPDVGSVRTRLDLELLHKLERQVRSRTTECRVSHANAVENVVVLGTG